MRVISVVGDQILQEIGEGERMFKLAEIVLAASTNNTCIEEDIHNYNSVQPNTRKVLQLHVFPTGV